MGRCLQIAMRCAGLRLCLRLRLWLCLIACLCVCVRVHVSLSLCLALSCRLYASLSKSLPLLLFLSLLHHREPAHVTFLLQFLPHICNRPLNLEIFWREAALRAHSVQGRAEKWVTMFKGATELVVRMVGRGVSRRKGSRASSCLQGYGLHTKEHKHTHAALARMHTHIQTSSHTQEEVVHLVCTVRAHMLALTNARTRTRTQTRIYTRTHTQEAAIHRIALYAEGRHKHLLTHARMAH